MNALSHKKRRKRKISFAQLCLLSLLTAIAGLFTGCNAITSDWSKLPEADRGMFDLTSWKNSTFDLITLQGEWEFYWNQLLEPTDFLLSANDTQQPVYVNVPGTWTSYEIDGQALPGAGYATYRLVVDAVDKDQIYGLKLGDMGSAYKIWINDQIIAVNGVVGESPTNSKPQFLPQVVTFNIPDNSFQVIVQVSNFHDRDGGMWTVPKFGHIAQIQHARERSVGVDLFLVGSLLIIGLYNLGLYALRRKDPSALYFGVFCVLISMRGLVTNERMFVVWQPDFSWELLSKFEYWTYYIAVSVFSLFLHSLYPKDFHKIVLYITQIIGVLFSLLVLVTPAILFTQSLLIYQLYTLSIGLYVIYIVFIAIIRHREGAKLLLVGSLVLFAAVVVDILSNNDFIQSSFIVPFGVLGFVFIQAVLLSNRFSKAFIEVEALSHQLERHRNDLESLVNERTAKLAETNKDLQQEIIIRQETEVALSQAKEQAESANRAKSDFLANMSHELRTPLNAILGYAQILQRDNTLTDPQLSAVGVMYQSGEHLLMLLNDILDISKIEAGKMELRQQTFSLSIFFNNLIDIFHTRAEREGISFIFRPSSDLPSAVKGDEHRLRQVLINLIGNAIKFTENGSVTLEVGYHLHKIRFMVRDTGIGIAPDMLEKIFSPFEQVGLQPNQIEGTGLGLAISGRLVSIMGSSLQVESTINEGSVFWFDLDLPTVDDWQAFPNLVGPTIVGYDGDRRSILIVDDKWANQAVLESMLQPLGFDIRKAEDGRECIEAVQQQRPDLILMDLLMPNIDGFEATRQLRQMPEYAQIPIIAISANALNNSQEASKAAGCNDFIVKPIQLDTLLSTIVKHLEISWQYGNESAPRIDKPLATSPKIGEVGLPSEEAAILFDLALRGDIKGIRGHLDDLTLQNPEYGSLIMQLKQLAVRYQIKQIRAMLEPYLEKAAQ